MNIWITEPSKWTSIFATLSERMRVLSKGLGDVENGILTIESIHSGWLQY